MRSATNDTMVYTFENEQYKLFNIVGIDKNHRNILSVQEINIESWEPLYRIPSFDNVGCFKVKGESQEVQLIAECDIKGKVLLVGDEIVATIPKIILDEAV